MIIEYKENTIIHADVLDGLKSIPDNEVSVVCSSPPYNCKVTYGDHNDDMPYADYLDWIEKVLVECHRILRKGGRVAWNFDSVTNLQKDGGDRMRFVAGDFYNIFKKIGFLFYQEHIWCKQNRCGKKTAWGSVESCSLPSALRSHEYVHLYSKEQYLLEGDKKNSDVGQDFYNYVGSEWNIQPETRNLGGHQAVYPEELAKRIIKLYSYRGDLIVDPFSGSGTTCYVSKIYGRRYFGIDNDPKFVKFANERLDMAEDVFEPPAPPRKATRRQQQRKTETEKEGCIGQFEEEV